MKEATFFDVKTRGKTITTVRYTDRISYFSFAENESDIQVICLFVESRFGNFSQILMVLGATNLEIPSSILTKGGVGLFFSPQVVPV